MKTEKPFGLCIFDILSEETNAVMLFVILFIIQFLWFPWFHHDIEFTFCWFVPIRQIVVLKQMMFATRISSNQTSCRKKKEAVE